jgi:hypothetical protein
MQQQMCLISNSFLAISHHTPILIEYQQRRHQTARPSFFPYQTASGPVIDEDIGGLAAASPAFSTKGRELARPMLHD